MYNLLVTAREGAWDLPAYEYDKSRFLEYSNDKEKALFKTLTAENIELLKSFPCLFAYEGDENDVRVGYIRAIKERGPTLFIEYEFDSDIDPIPFSSLEPILNLLDYRKSETYRTHWAVKDEDLFERLHSAGLIDTKFVRTGGEYRKIRRAEI